MDDGADICLVHAYTKGGSCDDQVQFVIFPAVEDVPTVSTIGVAVKDGNTGESIRTEPRQKYLGFGLFSDIQNRGTGKVPQGGNYGVIALSLVHELMRVIPYL